MVYIVSPGTTTTTQRNPVSKTKHQTKQNKQKPQELKRRPDFGSWCQQIQPTVLDSTDSGPMVRENTVMVENGKKLFILWQRARKGPGTTDLQKHALDDLLPSARLQFLKFPPLSETASPPETECLTRELVGSSSYSNRYTCMSGFSIKITVYLFVLSVECGDTLRL